MSIASAWLDIVVGVDFHVEVVPTPVPTPTPFPHPHCSVVWDPVGYVVGELTGMAIAFATGGPIAPAGPVLLGGRMATVTGDAASMPVKHIVIPPGTTFALGITPSDAELLVGSKTVLVRGSSAVRAGDPGLPCSEPIRLPTGVVVPTAPHNVMIGGPPAIDFGAAIGMIGGKALRNKWTAGKLHAIAAKVIPESMPRLRRLAHKSVCFFTGHPVNVATGGVSTSAVDFELPGPIPLRLERDYDTNWFDRDGPLGHGWSHTLDGRVWLEPGKVVVLTEDGRELEVPTREFHEGVMREGDEAWHPVERVTLRSLGKLRWEIRSADGLVRSYGPIAGELSADKDRGMARLVAIRDRAGHEVKFTYDERARLSQIVDSAGRTIGFEHDPHGRLRRVWLPAADGGGMRQHAEYRYDDAGDLVEVKDAAGKSWRFEYDGHLLVAERNRDGLSFYFQYDGHGRYARCIRTWGDGGIHDHVIAYDRQNRTTIVTNSLGEVTTYATDGLGMVVRIVRPHGAEIAYEYDEHTWLVAETDEVGAVTRYSYDARGNRTMVVAPDKAVTKIRYDERDQVVAVVLPSGAEHGWTYDRAGRVVTRTDALGHVTRYTYEGGDLVAIAEPGGATTQFRWTRAGDLEAITTADGATTKLRHDALGRLVHVTDARGNVQRRTWDALGRLVRVEEPDGNVREIAYDGEGHVVRARDRRRDVELSWWGLGQLASRTIAGTTVSYAYDTEGQLAAVTDEAGHVHRFERDASGEVIAEIALDELRKVFVRDAAGRCIKEVRPGVQRATTIARDAAGRPVAIEHADGSFLKLGYDADGALVRAENESSVLELRRDGNGRVIEERCTVGEDTTTVTRKLDAAGRVLGVKSSLGADVTIGRSAMGDVERLAQTGAGAKAWEAKIVRDLMGLEVDRQLPGGARSYWWRDALGRPTQHWVGQGTALARGRRYEWDAGDRLVSITEEGIGAFAFTHDRRGALTKVEHPDGRAELRLPDDVGNLFASEGGRDREYGRAGDIRRRTTPAGVVEYEYDAEGNLARRRDPDGGEWAYHFGDAGTLRKVDRPDGTAVVMTYDALGRRLSKSHGGVKTRYAWDGDVVLHAWKERDDEVWLRERTAEEEARAKFLESAKARLRATFPGDWQARWDEMLADDRGLPRLHAELRRIEADGPPEPPDEVDGAVVTWLHDPESVAPAACLTKATAHAIVTDHLGAPLCAMNDAGEVAAQVRLDAWGNAEIEGDAELVPHRYPGQWHDPETELHYNRHRHYDPATGQYISRDPIGLRGGLRAYGYVADPTTWSDALGLAGRPAAGAGCGGAAGANNDPQAARGYGVSDPPVRIDGAWSKEDLWRGLHGRPPRGLGSPDLHHADQMPGSGIHEVSPEFHRGNSSLHPNAFNQGITPEMRKQDRQLHWWYRAREQGAGELYPDLVYD